MSFDVFASSAIPTAPFWRQSRIADAPIELPHPQLSVEELEDRAVARPVSPLKQEAEANLFAPSLEQPHQNRTNTTGRNHDVRRVASQVSDLHLRPEQRINALHPHDTGFGAGRHATGIPKEWYQSIVLPERLAQAELLHKYAESALRKPSARRAQLFGSEDFAPRPSLKRFWLVKPTRESLGVLGALMQTWSAALDRFQPMLVS